MKRKLLLLILACLAKSVCCVDAAQPVHSTRQGKDATLRDISPTMMMDTFQGLTLPNGRVLLVI